MAREARRRSPPRRRPRGSSRGGLLLEPHEPAEAADTAAGAQAPRRDPRAGAHARVASLSIAEALGLSTGPSRRAFEDRPSSAEAVAFCRSGRGRVSGANCIPAACRLTAARCVRGGG